MQITAASWEKIYFEKVTVLDTEISVYADGENKKLHLLDLNNPSARTLENAIRMEYLGHLARFIRLMDISVYDIYLYHRDGSIREFNAFTDESIQLEPDDLHLYKPFKTICSRRDLATNPNN